MAYCVVHFFVVPMHVFLPVRAIRYRQLRVTSIILTPFSRKKNSATLNKYVHTSKQIVGWVHEYDNAIRSRLAVHQEHKSPKHTSP